MRNWIGGLLLAGTLVGAGCGDEAGGDGDLTKFIGAWKYTSGTETTNCGGTSQTDAIMDTITINRGVNSPLVMIDGNCILALDVNGATATARPSQECTTVSGGNSAILKLTAYTFTVNGIVAVASGSATAAVTIGGATTSCTYTSTGNLSKVSQ